MQCEHIKNNGERCNAKTLINTKYCYFHNPNNQKKRRQDAVRGGKSKLQRIKKPLPSIETNTMAEVVNLLNDTITRVRNGSMDLKTANTLGYLSSHLMKAIENSSFVERLEKLEKIVIK